MDKAWGRYMSKAEPTAETENEQLEKKEENQARGDVLKTKCRKY